MTIDPRKIRLGAFIQATGHHTAAWRHPDAQADAGLNIQHYRELAQTAERGKFDLVFVADSPGGQGGSDDPDALSRSEEHTSELQSLMRIPHAVFCLKKKKIDKG